MVYSGYILIRGIHISKNEMADFLRYLFGSSKVEQLEKESEDCGQYYSTEHIQKLLKENGIDLDVITKPCCYHDGTYFFGKEIGSVEFIYRDEVQEFLSFNTYFNEEMKQLQEIKEKYESNKDSVEKEIEKLIEIVTKGIQKEDEGGDFYEMFEEPSFYKFANDCESCS